MDKHQLPESLTVAPMWALFYVLRMVQVCQYGRLLRVVMAPDSWFDSVGPKVDGCFFNSTNGDGDLIIIRESATETGHWYDVLAHEFAHALHGGIDRLVSSHFYKFADHVDSNEDEQAYQAAVESFIPLLGGLVQQAMPKVDRVEFSTQ